MQTLFINNVIPNNHTEKVKSNEKRPGDKLGCTFCISVEYKIKRKFTFLANTKYISSRVVKKSAFSIVLRTRENTDFFTALDEIYLVFTSKKVNILYVLKR